MPDRSCMVQSGNGFEAGVLSAQFYTWNALTAKHERVYATALVGLPSAFAMTDDL